MTFQSLCLTPRMSPEHCSRAAIPLLSVRYPHTRPIFGCKYSIVLEIEVGGEGSRGHCTAKLLHSCPHQTGPAPTHPEVPITPHVAMPLLTPPHGCHDYIVISTIWLLLPTSSKSIFQNGSTMHGLLIYM